MRRLVTTITCVLVLLPGLLGPRAALAWPVDAHTTLLLKALGDRVEHGALVLPEPEDVVGMYSWIAHALAGAREPDVGGRERFFALYPEARSFDAIGARRFFGLSTDPNVEVFGISNFDKDAELDRYDVLLLASSRFHLDHRFRQPIRHDHVHQPMRLRDGSPLPEDPQTLHFGPLQGPASDDWALSALPASATRTDEAALHEAPWAFVAPVSDGVPVAGGAARMAQLHLDMSLMSLFWGGIELKVAGEYFSIIWLGVSLGVIFDAASPFAASQIGGPAVWSAAGRAYLLRAATSLGGVRGPMPSRAYLAARIRHNVRVVGERLIAEAIAQELDAPGRRPEAAALLRDLGTDDPVFSRRLHEVAGPWLRHDGKPDPFDADGGPALRGVAVLAEAATADTVAAYEAVVPLVQARWLDGDALLGDRPLPLDELLRDPDDPAVELARRALLRHAAPGLRRAATLARELHRFWDTANGRTALGRLRQGALFHLEERARRGDAWRAGEDPPPGGFGGERRPWIAGVFAALALLLLGGIVWRWRRRG